MRRKFACTKEDRADCRSKLGLAADAFVIGVIPGGSSTEARAPIADLLLPAFDALGHPHKHLVWLAGADYELLNSKLSDRNDITVLPSLQPPERLMAAADLVVVKANTGSTFEALALGVPVVAITQAADYVADRILRSAEGALLFDRRAADSGGLCAAIERQSKVNLEPILEGQDVAARAAARISELLNT